MCAESIRRVKTPTKKVTLAFQPYVIVSAVDRLLASRYERHKEGKLGFYKGSFFGSLLGILSGEFSKKESLRIPIALSMIALGGTLGYFVGRFKSRKLVYNQTLEVAKKLTEFYKSEIKGKLDLATSSNRPLKDYFKSEDEIYAALAIKLLLSDWNYIYVNRKGELVGSKFKVNRFAISTKKILDEYYLRVGKL